MASRIIRTSAVAAVFSGMFVVSGCGSDSSPLDVLPDTDQTGAAGESGAADISDGTISGGSTDDDSAGDTASETTNETN